MSATATVTGSVGPNKTVTAGVFSGINGVNFDCVNNVLSLTDTNNLVTLISITSATTITATKSGSTYTFTVS